MNKYKSFGFLPLAILLTMGEPIAVKGQHQNGVALQWYFGFNAGIEFTDDGINVLDGGPMIAEEGCASIADENGNLLFYTNGTTVYNSHHDTMKNGGNLNGHISSSQGAVIVQRPGTPHWYYVFTQGHEGDPRGLQFSIVDINKEDGLGAVIYKNIGLLERSSEKLCLVSHQNGTDTWVIAHEWNSNKFQSFLVSDTGVSKPVTSAVGFLHKGDPENAIGAMKISPKGNLLAVAHYEKGKYELLDFDRKNGQVSNSRAIPGTYFHAYGVEFSNNGEYLFFNEQVGQTRSAIYALQTGVCAEKMGSSTPEKIGESHRVSGAFQMAPNKSIYVAKAYSNSLGMITGTDSGYSYIDQALYLGGNKSILGLPNFNPFFFTRNDLGKLEFCANGQQELNLEETGTSAFKKGKLVNPATNVSYTIDKLPYSVQNLEPGTYNLEVESEYCYGSEFSEGTVTVNALPKEYSYEVDSVECGDEFADITFNLPDGVSAWENGAEITQASVALNEELQFDLVDTNNCSVSDTVVVNAYENCDYDPFFPNIITPNGDGKNDVFDPKLPPHLAQYQITILNRWGKVVFEGNDPQQTWNGQVNNRESSESVYFWVVRYRIPAEYPDPGRKEFKGTLTVIR